MSVYILYFRSIGKRERARTIRLGYFPIGDLRTELVFVVDHQKALIEKVKALRCNKEVQSFNE